MAKLRATFITITAFLLTTPVLASSNTTLTSTTSSCGSIVTDTFTLTGYSEVLPATPTPTTTATAVQNSVKNYVVNSTWTAVHSMHEDTIGIEAEDQSYCEFKCQFQCDTYTCRSFFVDFDSECHCYTFDAALTPELLVPAPANLTGGAAFARDCN